MYNRPERGDIPNDVENQPRTNETSTGKLICLKHTDVILEWRKCLKKTINIKCSCKLI